MRRQGFFWILTLLLICLTISSGKLFAQQQQQQQAPPSRLALEVTFYSGKPPAYETVPPAGSGPGGAWFGLFGRIIPWKPQPGAPAVEAVRVTSKIEGDAVRVYISALSGAKALENEAPVTNFLIRENEKNVVNELKEVGVQPFEIRLVRITPTPVPIPPVDNRTDSLVILNTEVAYDSTLPTYKLTLSNQSNKNIIALGIDMLVDGRIGTTMLRRDREGQIFMAPGKPYQLKIAAVRRAQPASGGYAPVSPSNQTILIRGAVFEDGTYEGEARTAATTLAFRAGEKVILLKLLPLLTDAIKTADANVAEGWKKLEAQVDEINTDADPELVKSISAKFSQPFDIKSLVETSEAGTKGDLLKGLQKLQAASAQSPDINTYRESLMLIKSRCEKWLSGLGAAPEKAEK